MPRAQQIVKQDLSRREDRQARREERREDRLDRKVDIVEAKTELNKSSAAKRKWLAVLLGIIIGAYFGFKYLGWF